MMNEKIIKEIKERLEIMRNSKEKLTNRERILIQDIRCLLELYSK